MAAARTPRHASRLGKTGKCDLIQLAIALILDACFGEPKWLWSRASHPAILIGQAIAWSDRHFNTGGFRRLKGVGLVLALIAVSILIGGVIQLLPFSFAFEVVIAAILLAHRSLCDHVADVGKALLGPISEGRRSVARIVGRDTRGMDEAAVARSAIESGAENFSDGVMGPALFFVVFGLPGILVYKAINTADSMIGYRTERYNEFGWAAARTDDVFNLVPARFTALLIAVLSGNLGRFPEIVKEARRHRSPNAGWPEAALARALGIALSGPRSYDGKLVDFPFVNPEGRHDIASSDIRAAVSWLWRLWRAILTLTLVSAGLTWWFGANLY